MTLFIKKAKSVIKSKLNKSYKEQQMKKKDINLDDLCEKSMISLESNSYDHHNFFIANSETISTRANNPIILLTSKILEYYKHGNSKYLYKEEMKPKRDLTTPNEPVYNNNRDNINYDLIVVAGDIVKNNNNNYKIIDSLGNGVSGQVYKCVYFQDKENYEISNIKNNISNVNGVIKESLEENINSQKISNNTNHVGIGTFSLDNNNYNISTNNTINICSNTTNSILNKNQKNNNQHIKQQELALKIIKNKRAFSVQALIEVKLLDFINNKVDPKDQYHFIRKLDSFVFHNHICIVFELLDENLFELLRQNYFKGLSLNTVRFLIKQILEGVYKLHQNNIIHCDLKPENIMLKISRNDIQLKITDFGTACDRTAIIYPYIQSRFYRAPEVIIGNKYSSEIDIWSVGCIAAELFLGEPLFAGKCEYDQILQIVSILGPLNLPISNYSKYHRYFDTNHQIRSPKDYYSQFPEDNEIPDNQKTFILKSLDDLSKVKAGKVNNNEMNDFILFLKEILVMVPEKRLSAKEALKHCFITKNKPEKKENIAMSHKSVSGNYENNKVNKNLIHHTNSNYLIGSKNLLASNSNNNNQNTVYHNTQEKESRSKNKFSSTNSNSNIVINSNLTNSKITKSLNTSINNSNNINNNNYNNNRSIVCSQEKPKLSLNNMYNFKPRKNSFHQNQSNNNNINVNAYNNSGFLNQSTNYFVNSSYYGSSMNNFVDSVNYNNNNDNLYNSFIKNCHNKFNNLNNFSHKSSLDCSMYSNIFNNNIELNINNCNNKLMKKNNNNKQQDLSYNYYGPYSSGYNMCNNYAFNQNYKNNKDIYNNNFYFYDCMKGRLDNENLYKFNLELNNRSDKGNHNSFNNSSFGLMGYGGGNNSNIGFGGKNNNNDYNGYNSFANCSNSNVFGNNENAYKTNNNIYSNMIANSSYKNFSIKELVEEEENKDNKLSKNFINIANNNNGLGNSSFRDNNEIKENSKTQSYNNPIKKENKDSKDSQKSKPPKHKSKKAKEKKRNCNTKESIKDNSIKINPDISCYELNPKHIPYGALKNFPYMKLNEILKNKGEFKKLTRNKNDKYKNPRGNKSYCEEFNKYYVQVKEREKKKKKKESSHSDFNDSFSEEIKDTMNTYNINKDILSNKEVKEFIPNSLFFNVGKRGDSKKSSFKLGNNKEEKHLKIIENEVFSNFSNNINNN